MPKSAFVALAGRPSSGKSTLVNRLCGAQVAVVSPVPQTTRNAIRGIVNGEAGQLVLVDTPGIHLSDKKLNKRLLDTALRTAAGADIILYILDAAREPGPEEELAASSLEKSLTNNTTLVAAINKTDVKGADVERAAAFVREKYPALSEGTSGHGGIFPISALTGEGVDALLAALFALAPEGEPFYPAEYYTDQEMDFRIAEVIRGEAINRLRQEIPHSIYVEVADLELRPSRDAQAAAAGKKRLWVRAFIVCERESQKGMIVGKGGALIKQIGEASRKKLNRLFDWRVELDLRVKTGKDWRRDDALLKKLYK
jgi:GTP-binding protein Era